MSSRLQNENRLPGAVRRVGHASHKKATTNENSAVAPLAGGIKPSLGKGSASAAGPALSGKVKSPSKDPKASSAPANPRKALAALSKRDPNSTPQVPRTIAKASETSKASRPLLKQNSKSVIGAPKTPGPGPGPSKKAGMGISVYTPAGARTVTKRKPVLVPEVELTHPKPQGLPDTLDLPGGDDLLEPQEDDDMLMPMQLEEESVLLGESSHPLAERQLSEDFPHLVRRSMAPSPQDMDFAFRYEPHEEAFGFDL